MMSYAIQKIHEKSHVFNEIKAPYERMRNFSRLEPINLGKFLPLRQKARGRDEVFSVLILEMDIHK